MSLTITTGAKSLFSLGVSVADIALLYKYGRKVGNFLSASKNEQELLESLMEGDGPQALLRRRALIDPRRMESWYPRLEFLYQGTRTSNAATPDVASKQELTNLSWLMVMLVAAFDLCLPRASVQDLIVGVFASILEGDDEVTEALRAQLDTLLQSWRDVAGVRKKTSGSSISALITHSVHAHRQKIVQRGRSIPQLNPAEFEEAKQFTIWLMAGKTYDYQVVSATLFAIAAAVAESGVLINTTGAVRAYDTQPIVRYTTTGIDLGFGAFDPDAVLGSTRGVSIRAQLITYPRGHPHYMIDALDIRRDVANRMNHYWKLGKDAAASFQFTASATTPFSATSDIFYTIQSNDPARNRFGPELSMLASHAFPHETQSILSGIEKVVRGYSPKHISWLHQHTGLEYLLHSEAIKPNGSQEDIDIWLSFQALVFGFYYELLAQLVDLSFVRDDAFFRGVWGVGSTTFLAACSQFSHELQKYEGVGRGHILYMLSTMYGGRFKLYSPSSQPIGLVGVLGNISVLTLPLLRVTDEPKRIRRFAVVELPIIDLASENHGELLSATGCNVRFSGPPQMPRPITPRGPKAEWSVHARMGSFVGHDDQRVVMAARCDGRLIGSFSPLAADVAFLSSAYMQQAEAVSNSAFNGFEVTDKHWQETGAVQPMPEVNSKNVFGIVQSTGCPSLRYAAAGAYLSVGEEISIANGDLDAAFGRVEGQGRGVVIG